jgi:hypothetical protein
VGRIIDAPTGVTLVTPGERVCGGRVDVPELRFVGQHSFPVRGLLRLEVASHARIACFFSPLEVHFTK